MTGRERLIAAVRGGEVDRKPTLTWGLDAEADGVIVPLIGLPEALDPNRIVIVDVPNAYGLARIEGVDLNAVLEDDPAEGATVQETYLHQVCAWIENALAEGADGVCYRLHGATPVESTPMQYGGFHLERDREVLAQFQETTLNLVFAEGQDPYLDFVSDLPGHAFGWNVASSQVSLDNVRSMRRGALALDHPDADIRLRIAAKVLHP